MKGETLQPVVVHLAAALTAFVVTALIMPKIIRAARSARLLDQPDGDRRVHTTPIPRLGGIGVALGTGIGILVASLIAKETIAAIPQGMLFGGLVILLVGIADDIRGAPPIFKIAGQTVAALIVVGYGLQLRSVELLPGLALPLGVAGSVITVLWIVGVTNAFNLIDGADGLAGSFALLAIGSLLVVEWALHRTIGDPLLFALAGATIAFLRDNWNPAKIFLGDTGSMSLGFLLAVHSISTATRADGSTLMLIPIFAFAFPLTDTLMAMARRWLRGYPISRADGRHIHHQLLGLGLRTSHVVQLLVLFFGSVSALGISINLAPPQFSTSLALGGIIAWFALFVVGIRWLRYDEFLELGSAIVVVLRSARPVLREKIVAGDTAARIESTKSLEEVRRLLDDAAAELGLLQVELITDSLRHGAVDRPIVLPRDAKPCRLDYFIALDGENGSRREAILRVWSVPRALGLAAGSAERLVLKVGPAVGRWLAAQSVTREESRATLVSN